MQSNKLHLGCGKNYMPGWVNVDLFSTVKADVYSDITSLPFPAESFDLIYASHVLEHVQRNTVIATLGHWQALLKPGGVLRLAVPDFAACVAWYNRTGDLKSLMGLLYGGQNHPKNNHFVIFDEGSLSEVLRKLGFKNIRTWDWTTTEHAEFDDYSRSYLPHLDFEKGQLMSLNLEATK